MSRLAAGWLPALVAAGAAAWLPSAAHACAVCYGAAESPVITGTRLSIVFLLVLTYLLLGGGIAGFVLLRRRAIRNTDATAPRPLAASLGGQPQATEGPT